MARAIWPAVSSAVVMSLAVYSVGRVRPVQNLIALLVLQVLVGGVTYLACFWFGHRSASTAALWLVVWRETTVNLRVPRVDEGLA